MGETILESVTDSSLSLRRLSLRRRLGGGVCVSGAWLRVKSNLQIPAA